MKKTIEDLKLAGKTVLVRVDFNVPIKNGVVQSDKRIIEALPTIQKIIHDGGKAVLFSHLGRVKTLEERKTDTMRPVAELLGKKLGMPVKFVAQTRGAELEKAIKALKPKEVLMFENTRFEDLDATGKEVKFESKNDATLGKYWASLGDVFINDAFGTAHRAAASNVGIATYIKESAIGYLIEKELKMLSKAVNNPEHPVVAIIGGAKVSDKIGIIEALLKKSDKVLIGGGMAFTFLKAQGHEIGKSLVEAEFLDVAKKTLAGAKGRLLLPVDHAMASTFADEKPTFSKGLDVAPDKMGLDIGPKSIELFTKALQGAKTVIWNGPMGVSEFKNYRAGTVAIATAIANQKGVYSIIGGGDSAAAAIDLGFEKKFSHISTGGGASLEYLEGKPLPGVEAIQSRNK